MSPKWQPLKEGDPASAVVVWCVSAPEMDGERISFSAALMGPTNTTFQVPGESYTAATRWQ